MDGHFRHFPHGKQGEVVEIALNHTPVFNGDFLVERHPQSRSHLHFNLAFHDQRIHQKGARVKGDINPLHCDLSRPADGNAGHDSANTDLGTAGPSTAYGIVAQPIRVAQLVMPARRVSSA